MEWKGHNQGSNISGPDVRTRKHNMEDQLEGIGTCMVSHLKALENANLMSLVSYDSMEN